MKNWWQLCSVFPLCTLYVCLDFTLRLSFLTNCCVDFLMFTCQLTIQPGLLQCCHLFQVDPSIIMTTSEGFSLVILSPKSGQHFEKRFSKEFYERNYSSFYSVIMSIHGSKCWDPTACCFVYWNTNTYWPFYQTMLIIFMVTSWHGNDFPIAVAGD